MRLWFIVSQANEVLLGGKKLTAAEAYDRGLVTSVFPSQEFQSRVKEVVTNMAGLPPKVRTVTHHLKCMHRLTSMYVCIHIRTVFVQI